MPGGVEFVGMRGPRRARKPTGLRYFASARAAAGPFRRVTLRRCVVACRRLRSPYLPVGTSIPLSVRQQRALSSSHRHLAGIAYEALTTAGYAVRTDADAWTRPKAPTPSPALCPRTSASGCEARGDRFTLSLPGYPGALLHLRGIYRKEAGPAPCARRWRRACFRWLVSRAGAFLRSAVWLGHAGDRSQRCGRGDQAPGLGRVRLSALASYQPTTSLHLWPDCRPMTRCTATVAPARCAAVTAIPVCFPGSAAMPRHALASPTSSTLRSPMSERAAACAARGGLVLTNPHSVVAWAITRTAAGDGRGLLAGVHLNAASVGSAATADFHPAAQRRPQGRSDTSTPHGDCNATDGIPTVPAV